jgi:hypothetical protein
MEETKTYVFGNDGYNRGFDPAWLLASNNGGFGNFGGAGWIGLILLAALFGWGGFGNGGFGGFGGNSGVGFLANQLNNDNGRDLIMEALGNNRTAIGELASTLNSDFNTVSTALNGINSAVQSVGTQVGMSGLEVINSIQSGNASLSRQLCECCCENRLLTTEQGYQAQIRTIEQTNQLGSQADRNTAVITGAIAALHTDMTREFCDVKERELQDKIDSLTASNTILRGQIDNAAQTAQFAAMLAPINTKLVEIENKQPNTVPVQWPALTAVNTTPYVSGGFYGSGFNGYGYGNGFGWGGSYWG